MKIEQLEINHFKIDEYTDWRLKNWSRYVTFGNSPGHCSSIEHKYIPESDLDNEEKRKPTTLTDSRDAIIVEKILTNPNFPIKSRKLIVNEYALHRNFRYTCRELGIRFSAYSQKLYIAANMINNRDY